MKKTLLSQYLCEEGFINKVLTILEEKYKVYPSVKIGNHTIKLKDGYFTIHSISLALKEIFRQGQA